ncbi:unnamed protein product [Soboliphyme baturini]|uniref:Mediator complex subunit 20 n=1 Tax=Soboliphyme baturini TaxID=241478 RepID=A0A183IDW2_9BILA|nr:unnamed protein product [Soboliphyme baturini]
MVPSIDHRLVIGGEYVVDVVQKYPAVTTCALRLYHANIRFLVDTAKSETVISLPAYSAQQTLQEAAQRKSLQRINDPGGSVSLAQSIVGVFKPLGYKPMEPCLFIHMPREQACPPVLSSAASTSVDGVGRRCDVIKHYEQLSLSVDPQHSSIYQYVALQRQCVSAKFLLKVVLVKLMPFYRFRTVGSDELHPPVAGSRFTPSALSELNEVREYHCINATITCNVQSL